MSKSELSKGIGGQIKKYVKSKGIRLTELSKMSGVNYSTLNNAISGESVNVSTYEAILDALGLTLRIAPKDRYGIISKKHPDILD